jgi:Uri superfamily endonuclease
VVVTRVISAGRWGQLVVRDAVGCGFAVVDGNSGHYATLVHVVDPFRAEVRGLGVVRFERGFYANVGTMKRGIINRVARHLTRKKELGVWNVDRLTTAPAAVPLGCVLVPWPLWTEHTLSDAVGARLHLRAPISGFSAADCNEGCEAHLWYSQRPISLVSIARAVRGVCATLLDLDRTATARPRASRAARTIR